MKKTAFISFLCAVCMLISISAQVFAAEDTPYVTAYMDKSEKKAEIVLNDVSIMIYSAQVTLKINGEDIKFSVKPNDSSAYATVTQESGTVTVYVDSMKLMDGSSDIILASLTGDKTLKIGDSADVVLVDRGMKSHSYENVQVKHETGSPVINTPKPTTKPTPKPTDDTAVRPNGNTTGTSGGNIASSSHTAPINPVSSASGNNAVTPNTEPRRFDDVPDTHWAKSDIMYVVSEGLFDGISDYIFEPNTLMTRAMYVTVLSRFGNSLGDKWNIACDTPKAFSDVASGTWFSDAVAWAGGIGLVKGIDDDLFGPDLPVTREQIAVMTENFAYLCGVTLPSVAETVEFTDNDAISDWAVYAVKKAQAAGIIGGREDGSFAPQDPATRAEVAAILSRFVKAVN